MAAGRLANVMNSNPENDYGRMICV